MPPTHHSCVVPPTYHSCDSRLVRSSCEDIDCGNVLFDRTYYASEGKSADEADRWVGVYVCLYALPAHPTLLYLLYPQQRPVTATHRIAVYVPGQLRRVLPEDPTGVHTLTAAQTPPLHLFIHLSIHPPIYPSIHPPMYPSVRLAGQQSVLCGGGLSVGLQYTQ